ncbi:tyrosine-type recombinase/integrase, partial [Neobacillus vireti]|uniref:tyrosine-type recombinase/integrase n=1 Tax=Neobacillus vireti TaxID=220686 RepID=UPI002FFFEDD6
TEITNDIGNKSLHSVKQKLSIIKNFYEWLEEQFEIESNPVKYGSKKNKNTNQKYLKSKFLYGQVWNYEIENSISRKLKFKKKQNHIKWYKDKEIEMLIDTLPSLRDKLIFKISIETGMRIGEILGLYLDHFNMHEGILLVRKNENIENRARAKTRERDLYISPTLTEELSEYIRGVRSQVDVDFSHYLFLNHHGSTIGKAVTPRNYLSILKKAAVKAGFNDTEIRTHSGRSTLAQKLLDSLYDGKVTENYILQQFGWDSISTLQPYTHAFNEKNRAKVAKEIVLKQINLPSIDLNGEKK